MLGACALRDIGYHFPDTDPAFKGIDSRLLLREVVKLIADKGYICHNADITVVAERPKLSGFIEQMRAVVAEDLGVAVNQVNVKATTSEGLGFTGIGQGIAAHAVVTIIASE